MEEEVGKRDIMDGTVLMDKDNVCALFRLPDEFVDEGGYLPFRQLEFMYKPESWDMVALDAKGERFIAGNVAFAKDKVDWFAGIVKAFYGGRKIKDLTRFKLYVAVSSDKPVIVALDDLACLIAPLRTVERMRSEVVG